MTSELLLYVAEVAEQLLADLAEGERQTRQWADRRKASRLVTESLDRCLESLAATGLVGRANEIPSGELWRVAGEILQVGELQAHARFKPRGYAGDHVMLGRILERFTSAHPLGQLFDEYFQSQDAPEAVRNRTRIAADTIVRHYVAAQNAKPGVPAYHLVCIGAGPAAEIELAASAWAQGPTSPRVTLFDLDAEALDLATQRLSPLLLPGNLLAVRENLFRLTRVPAKAAAMAEADCIICLGLFDYLADADASAMLQLFWRHLNPGGVMLVGNFSPACRARSYMEWIGNWYLTYRDRDTFARLARDAGIPTAGFEIETERQGVNLLLRATKPR